MDKEAAADEIRSPAELDRRSSPGFPWLAEQQKWADHG
jgi:hypothetical protein